MATIVAILIFVKDHLFPPIRKLNLNLVGGIGATLSESFYSDIQFGSHGNNLFFVSKDITSEQGWSTRTCTCTRTYSSTFFTVLSCTLYLADFMSTCTRTYLSTFAKNPVLMSTLRVLLSTFLNLYQIGKKS